MTNDRQDSACECQHVLVLFLISNTLRTICICLHTLKTKEGSCRSLEKMSTVTMKSQGDFTLHPDLS